MTVSINFNPALSFDDVNLLDDRGKVKSRSEVDLKVHLKGNHHLELPILSASMDTINSSYMAVELMRAGAGQVHHRYCPVEKRIFECKIAAGNYNIAKLAMSKEGVELPYGINGVAIGLTETEADVEDLIVEGLVDLISIDVAACYHQSAFDQILRVGPICEYLGIPLMVGNFSNELFLCDLYNSPAGRYVTLVKVGIGGGSVCSTRVKTGVGKPTFQSVVDAGIVIQSYGMPYKLVADGGIRSSGDIVKAIGAGADLVMLGGMLAAHNECPNGHSDKVSFRGMASEEAKRNQFDELKNIEGVSTTLESRGPVSKTLKHIKEGIQSGIATAGYRSLKDFKGNGNFVKVTSSGVIEGRPHILG